MNTKIINTMLNHVAAYKTKAVAAKNSEDKERYAALVDDFKTAVAVLKKDIKGEPCVLDDYIGCTVRIINPHRYHNHNIENQRLVVCGYQREDVADKQNYTLICRNPDNPHFCGVHIRLDDCEIVDDREAV